MDYTKRSTKYLLYVVIFGLILFCFGLNFRHFWGTTEGRTGQIAKEMLTSGDWVIPHLNYEPRLTKPPLYFWSVAVLSKYCNDGKVSEWAARLPAALSALLVVIMTFLIGQRLYSDSVGLIASLCLATSHSFLWQGRTAALDMMLVLFVTSTIMFFTFGLTASLRNKKYYYILMHASCALAVMAKGPVGIFVPWLGILTYLIWTRQTKEFKHMQWIAGGIVFVLIVAPWLISVKSRITSSFGVFYHETVTRYTSAFDHKRPFYYFIYRLPLYVLPWGIFIPFFIWDMAKNRTMKPYRYPVSFFLPAFIFFSLCGSKRSYYLMPLYPFIMLAVTSYIRRSLVIRKWIDKVIDKFGVKKIFLAPLAVMLVVMTVFFLLMPILNNRNSSVDLCGKLNEIMGPNDNLVTYRYSRPYIVFYFDRGNIPELNEVEQLHTFLDQSTDKARSYILLQEKDFKEISSLASSKIVLRYPNFTKKDNDMVLITAPQKGELLETR